MPSAPPPLPTPDTALFLDLDGTVLELGETPSAVSVDPSLRDQLARLSAALGGALAMVSGRSIGDLDRLLAPLTLPVAGQHGLEWRGADGRLRRHPAPALPDGMFGDLERFVAAYPGTILEAKGASFAIHFRQRPEWARAVALCAADTAAAAGPGWEVLQGKMMTELRPAGIHKGEGIRQLMAAAPFAGRRPTFLGDDWTDEDGFMAVNALGGSSVAVAVTRDTHAQFHLGSVADVHEWLGRAADALRPAREHA